MILLDQDQYRNSGTNPYVNSILKEDRDLLKLRMLIEDSSQKESKATRCFANKIQIDLKKRDVLQHYSKTVYYTIISLFLIVAAVSICLKQLKQIITNYQAAQSLSLGSLSISLVWHFCLFWQHIIFVGIGSYYQFLRFPACGFFLQSFIFEMRLIQEVFKGHYYAEL